MSKNTRKIQKNNNPKSGILRVNEKVFPTVLMIIDVLAAFVYFTKFDWRKTMYWLAAAVLTFVVTY